MKRKNSVGYFSAYYRGLECLLKMWPSIREVVPDATLDVYYGWESWVAFQGEDDFYDRMERLFEDLKPQGVTVHGRVSHEELATAMKAIQVWAYPTEFEEIHCITALKAQAAGCWPVVTDVGALTETVQNGFYVGVKDIYTNKDAQAEFIRCVVRVLTDDGDFSRDITPENAYWSDVAREWDAHITTKLLAKS